MDFTAFAAIIAAVLGAGGIGGIVAFRKAGPEMEATAVGTLRQVIDELRTEVERLRDENRQLRNMVERLEQDLRRYHAARDDETGGTLR